MILKGYQALTFKDGTSLYLSYLNKIYVINLLTSKIEELFRFDSDLFTLLSSFSSVLRRLFRKDIRLSAKIDNENIILIKDSYIYKFNSDKKLIESKFKLPRGSRPLNITSVKSLAGFNDGVYFGEYFSNPKKESVKIFQYVNDNLKVVYEFPKGTMNHIHNLVVDHYRECIWLLAGDIGDSSAIYQIKNNFSTVERVVYGKQQYRSCVAFTISEGLLYATDSQYETNSIRLLNNIAGDWSSDHICDINGPSIFGCQLQEKFYFSTSVEGLNSGNLLQQIIRNKRGPGVKKNQSEIISGNLTDGFKVIYSNKKDIWPFLLFQFGNIIFPTGDNLSKKLIFTNIALQKNDFSTKIIQNEIL